MRNVPFLFAYYIVCGIFGLCSNSTLAQYELPPPTVESGEAANVTSSSATLNGTSSYQRVPTASFEYGTTSGSYGWAVSATVTFAMSKELWKADISGLSPATTYYYRISAYDSWPGGRSDTTYGSEKSFTTLETTSVLTPMATITPTSTPQPPTVTTGEATFDYSSYVLTLTGTVNAHGLPTTAWFGYGKSSGFYNGTSTTQSVSGTNDTAVSINVIITELPPTNTGITYYYYRIVAENDTGISYGEEKSLDLITPIIDCLCGVSGKVTDSISKEGIRNAAISGFDAPTSYTSTSGYYSWNNGAVPCYSGGSYALTASADGYESLTQNVDVEPCIEKTLNFELQPITIPTPTPTVTPVSECEEKKITVSPRVLKLKRRRIGEVTVTLEGDNCVPEGKTVTVSTGKIGSRRISISPTTEVTDENGQVKFTITAKDTPGNARITFKANSLKKTTLVKVRR